jgi:signal transduction histidine kinase
MENGYEALERASSLLASTNVQHVLEEIIHIARDVAGADHASLFLLQDPTHVDWNYIYTARQLSGPERIQAVNSALSRGFAGWVVENQRGDIIADTQQDPRWLVFPDDRTVARSAMCVPFIHEGTVVATLTLTSASPDRFDRAQLRLVSIIANQAAIAIRNAQLITSLRAQHQQLRGILLAVHDGLLVIDREGRVLLANDAIRELLGDMPHEALAEVSIAALAAGAPWLAPLADALASGTTCDRWTYEARSEGVPRDLNIAIAPWAAEHTSGYVIITHDVTHLRDLNRFKDDMLRIASHDLRSPLALVSGYAEMIEMEVDDPQSTIHRYVGVIQSTTERIAALVEDILRVERIRTSPLELRETVDMVDLANFVVEGLVPEAEARRIHLAMHVPPVALAPVTADPILIRQAMQNLIGNALKYTLPGGSVQVRLWDEGDRACFAVKDTGVGISAEHLPFVYESFYRVPNENVKAVGSGLGLSLVKRVIERHAGDVWVTSEPGSGSEFGFWLPVSQRNGPPEADRGGAAPAH